MTPKERLARIQEMVLRIEQWEKLISEFSAEESWTIEQEAAYQGAHTERNKCQQIIGEHVAELARKGFTVRIEEAENGDKS